MQDAIAQLQQLSDDGWCVVLKRMPPDLGWIIQGARSEYDAPCEDQRIGHGKWLCEVQDVRFADGYWRPSQFAMCDTALEAVERVREEIKEESKRRAAITKSQD